MTDYLDVAVVRIQSYLTRAPSLKGRRGASTMVSEASARARDQRPRGTQVNDEAGAVDGVVSLRLDGADSREAATAVLTRLRRALPASELTAALWRGPSYVAARGGTPAWTVEWPPAVAEWPLAKTCDWCRTWPASARVTGTGGEPALYCVDCARRHPEAGAATDPRPGRAPGPERELLRLLPGHELPDDFAALARALGRGIDDTHVATIYADGNGIGDLMAARGHPPELADRIHKATWNAVVETVAALPRIDVLPVIPHLVGGDDVLISLPAHLVWPGVRELLTRFGEFDEGVSLSAGVVCHHASEPLSDVVDLAGSLLAQAKRQQRGRAAVAWQSITHDGPLPVDRSAMPLHRLDASWDALHAPRDGRHAGRSPAARPILPGGWRHEVGRARATAGPRRPGAALPVGYGDHAGRCAGRGAVVAAVIELRFRIEFATPFRVSTGHAAPGVDAAVDSADPLPASSLKGVMRATAVDLGVPEDLVKAVFGAPKRESPWVWSGAVAVDGWAAPQPVTRIALDEHHSARTDMLGTVERTAAGAAEFTVVQRARCAVGSEPESDALARHRAVLAIAGQATRSLGAGRRRGFGWVHIRCLTAPPCRDDVALVLRQESA